MLQITVNERTVAILLFLMIAKYGAMACRSEAASSPAKSANSFVNSGEEPDISSNGLS
jgi:hypothetical protein